MKLLVTLTLCAICLNFVKAKSESAIRQDAKPKVSTKLNSITSTPKPDSYQPQQQYQQEQIYQQQNYQQQNYQQPQYPQHPLQPQLQRQLHPHLILQPQVQQALYQSQVQVQPQHHLMHVIQKAFYVPQQQNQPAAMIIIAQPTYVPAHAVQGGATQRLLHYFHNNPQARQQLLHGHYQQQPGQQIVQQPAGAHTIGNYQVVAVAPQYRQNLIAIPAQVPHPTLASQPAPAPSAEAAPQPSPLQLAQIAQIASQQYSRINPSPQQEQNVYQTQQYQYQSAEGNAQQSAQSQDAVPIRSLPPIITGFENFSPEQQEKIKAQLSAHFGAPLQPLPTGARTTENQPQEKGSNQYSTKYQTIPAGLSTSEFVASQQVKGDSNASSSNVSRLRYNKSNLG